MFEAGAGSSHNPLLSEWRDRTCEDWSKVQKQTLLSLFARMSKDVPAYARFIEAAGQRDAGEVESIPSISKANYLRQNSFPDLFWNGTLRQAHVLTSTSGSTGKPTYFGRSHNVDDRSSLIHELVFRSSSLNPEASTLVIVCFGMGVWIGGLITYQAFEKMGRRGYPISVITPGINKEEILKALRDLAPNYEQLILCGYPPFLKDVVDDAHAQGISFEKHRVSLLFAAEAFTETFRDYLVDKVGLSNELTDTANIYGSADIGTMAFETPISILARRIAMRDNELFADIFNGASKTPTLAQYVPEFVTFEAPEGEILISGDSAVPLLRYSIGDQGGVHTFDELVERFAKHGVDLLKEAKDAQIEDYMLKLPFVYVYERSDLATTLYGLQVYPETVKEVLLDDRFNAYVTGKLALVTRFDDNQNQYLEINIELRSDEDLPQGFESELITSIVRSLIEKNAEFSELSKYLGDRATPKLVFWPYEDKQFFRPGIKQRWVVKDQR